MIDMKHFKKVTVAKPSVARASVVGDVEDYISQLFGRVFDIGGVHIKVF
jgi:hypothetical protein